MTEIVNPWSTIPQDVFLKIILDNDICGRDLISFCVSNAVIFHKCNYSLSKKNIFHLLQSQIFDSTQRRIYVPLNRLFNSIELLDIRRIYCYEQLLHWPGIKKQLLKKITTTCQECVDLDKAKYSLSRYRNLTYYFDNIYECLWCDKYMCDKHLKFCERCDLMICNDHKNCNLCLGSFCHYCSKSGTCKICLRETDILVPKNH